MLLRDADGEECFLNDFLYCARNLESPEKYTDFFFPGSEAAVIMDIKFEDFVARWNIR